MLSHETSSYHELLIELVEVKKVLTSHPLTVVSAEDIEKPLTSSHLIVGCWLRGGPDPQCPEPEEFVVDFNFMIK